MGKSKQQRNSDNTRERLLKAVEDVLLQKGYSRLKAAEVANQAGVDPKTIKNHFGSFNGLLRTYFHDNYFWLPEPEMHKITTNDPKEYLAEILKQRFFTSWRIK